MKISRTIVVLSCFAITFIILLITGTFFASSKMKILLIATYFAGWVALLVFCVCTFLFPQAQAAGEVLALFSGHEKNPKSFPPAEETQVRSSHSDLPMQERIAAYVAERRREEGLPAPVPLRKNQIEEKRGLFPEKSVSSASVAAAVSYMSSSRSGTETASEFDGHLDLDTTNADDVFRADARELLKNEKYLDLEELFEEGTEIFDEEFLDYAASIDDEELQNPSVSSPTVLPKPFPQYEYSQNTGEIQHFSDISISGEAEQRQAIPPQTIPTDDLKREYEEPISQTNEAAKKAKLHLNFANIDILREESNAVRTTLYVEESIVPAEKALLADIHEVTALYVSLSPEARHLVDRLGHSSWECEQMPEDEALITEINRLAKHYIGYALLVKEGNIVTVEDDYRNELTYIYENPPQLPEMNDISRLFDLPVLPSELREFVEYLVPEQQKALHVLLTCEQPQSELERIAEGSMTMPQTLLDQINEVAIQTLGDLLVDFVDQEPHILDEYITSLKESIVWE